MEDIQEIYDRIKDKYTLEEFIYEMDFTFEDLIDTTLADSIMDNYAKVLKVLE